jgi:hypothetical protein
VLNAAWTTWSIKIGSEAGFNNSSMMLIEAVDDETVWYGVAASEVLDNWLRDDRGNTRSETSLLCALPSYVVWRFRMAVLMAILKSVVKGQISLNPWLPVRINLTLEVENYR